MEIDTSDIAFQPAYLRARRMGLGSVVDVLFGADATPYAGVGQALLVPVNVQALVVTEDGAVDHADVAVRLLDAETFHGDLERTTVPFTDGGPRPRGVLVHWAMPDSLTRGVADATGTVDQQALPDRWLVIRLSAGARRRWIAWVVESDYGRVTPLSAWDGESAPLADDAEPPAGWVPRERLSATSGGDPAWAAVYDNVVDRFALHDPLAGVDQGATVSYVVVGWYGDQTLDPLHTVRLGGTFDQVLAALRWSIDSEARRALDALDLADVAAGTESEPGEAAGPAVTAALRAAEHSLSPSTRERTADWVADVVDEVVPRSVWPRRCVLHGAVFGVQTDGGDTDKRPSPPSLRAAVGATSTEAMATLIGERQPGSGSAEVRATAAFAYGVADRLSEHDGPAVVDEHLHTRAFESRPGGVTIDHIRVGDRLAGLRPSAADAGGGATSILDAISGIGIFGSAAAREHLGLLGDTPLHESVTSRTARGGTAPAAAAAGIGPRPADQPAIAATTAGWAVSFEFAAAREELRYPRHSFELAAAAARRPPERVVPVRRPLPRWYVPQDPVVAIQGVARDLRHGHDGRLTPDETTACRLGSGIADRWDDIDGAELLARPLVHPALPPEAAPLLEEAALEDPSNLEGTVEAAAAATGLPAAELRERIRAEHVIGRYGRDPALATTGLADASTRDGTLSSAIAVTEWTGQPWIPLYLEWAIDLDLGDRLEGWSLGELDLDPPDVLPPVSRRVLAGRSLLASATVKALASEIDRALTEEVLADLQVRGVLSAQTEATLRRVASAAGTMDVLAAGLDGLRDHLLGYRTNLAVDARPEGAPPATPSEGDPPAEPLALGDALLSAGGVARLTRARLVDAFGRTLEVPLENLVPSAQLAVPGEVVLAEDPDAPLGPDDGDGDTDEPPPAPRILLRPRVNLPARLMLRLVDPDDDTAEVRIDQRTPRTTSPVAGWLVPDHVDHAIEVFDAEGLPLGQLRRDVAVAPRHGGAVVWEGTPGTPGPAGVSPGELIVDRHVRSFVTRLVERDLARREAPDGEDRESPLSALLRALDTTQWTIDPVSSIGWEFPGALVGRPLAVVRATATLEVRSDLDDPRWPEHPDVAMARRAALNRLRSRPFEVRLGALTRLHDGLFGYVVDDDYWHLHPVHPSVLATATASGPGAGFQQDADTAVSFDPTAEDAIAPIEDPYLAPDPTIALRPGQTRTLTLLMDPGLSIHVTTGCLPRKEIALLRDWVEAPLRTLAPSFRIGPVLVDPTTIRMPKPAGMPGRQVWTRRDGSTWRDDPIETATQAARLPDGAHEAQEGWIRLVYEQDIDG